MFNIQEIILNLKLHFKNNGSLCIYKKKVSYMRTGSSDSKRWLLCIRHTTHFSHLSAGRQCHADDDGRERGRLCAGVGVWIRGYESLPVPSRFFLFTETLSHALHMMDVNSGSRLHPVLLLLCYKIAYKMPE